ncbi:putative free-standing HNH family homing endonuclease [Vibrio phage PVA23]|nr:putative free-standing HNH family homing endonuclease [Vibrio phage PVA23]
MNYERIYNELIARAVDRSWSKENSSEYIEMHHIVPRCMNGTDDSDNIVALTAREHYIAHWLLYKRFRNYGTLNAWYAMCMSGPNTKRRYTSRTFAYARKHKAESQRGVPKTPEHRMKISIALKNCGREYKSGEEHHSFGKTLSEDKKLKISQSQVGKRVGDKNPMFGTKHSKETLSKISKNTRGKNTAESHPKFRGYYHTPNGVFSSLRSAAKENGCSASTVQRYIRNEKEGYWFEEI